MALGLVVQSVTNIVVQSISIAALLSRSYAPSGISGSTNCARRTSDSCQPR